MKKLYFSLLTFLFLVTAHAQIVNIPDANFKAKLLAADTDSFYGIASNQTPNASGYVSSYNKIDINNDGEIQISEALNIKYLNVSDSNINSLEGISTFTNLENLNFKNNQVTGNLEIQNLSFLRFLNCTNNQLTGLNLNILTNLILIQCSYNQLTSLDLTMFPNLKTVRCSYNQLTSLDLSMLTNLTTVSCTNNQITTLNLSNTTNLIDLDCTSNNLSVLSIQSMPNLKTVRCALNANLNSLDLLDLPLLEVLSCHGCNLSTLNVNNLYNLNELVCANNQLDSLQLDNLTSLTYLNCGGNNLSQLNVSNLINLISLIFSYNQVETLDVSNLTNLATLICRNNNISTFNLKNGFNYTLSTSTTDSYLGTYTLTQNPVNYICADENKIQSLENYFFSGVSPNINSYCSFVPGGTFYTIEGNNNFDANSNGCDASDSVYPNLKFNITNGTTSGSLLSDASGNYAIPVSEGTHTITPQFENPSYFTVSPANSVVSFPTEATPFIQNFCIAPNGVHHDLEVVVIPLEPARPGFDATYKIKYKNKGNLNETTTLNFNYNEDILDLVSTSYASTIQSAGLLSWDLGTIAPFETGEIIVTLNVNSPMETPAVNADDILNYFANIVGLITDETPDDNTFSLNQIVVNSFDPNDKTCLEGDNINPSMIGKYVHYKIRFENTGTFPAQNVVIKDLIDTAKFDLSTLQMTDASHNCITRITNPNKVEFIFENINLPFDDANNDGYVVFKIKTKPTLTVNSTISNLANIYFDYNFPIVTNTATSTFQVLNTEGFTFENYFTIYPNPVKNELNLNTKQATTVHSLSIYNILGQLVQTTTNPEKAIDVSGLKTGNYIVKVTTDKGVSSGKFVKE